MGFEDFVSRKLVQDGVVRQLEIIGGNKTSLT